MTDTYRFYEVWEISNKVGIGQSVKVEVLVHFIKLEVET